MSSSDKRPSPPRLTPEDIQAKRFHDAFRGYNHQEVDVFLDEAAATLLALHQENARLQEEAQAALDHSQGLEGELKDARVIEVMLKRTLLAAQRAADEVVAEAESRARQTVAAAQEKSSAEESNASVLALEILAEARVRQEEIEARCEQLRGFDVDYRQRLRAQLQSQLSALDELPPPPGPVVLPAPAELLAPGHHAAPRAEDPPEGPAEESLPGQDPAGEDQDRGSSSTPPEGPSPGSEPAPEETPGSAPEPALTGEPESAGVPGSLPEGADPDPVPDSPSPWSRRASSFAPRGRASRAGAPATPGTDAPGLLNLGMPKTEASVRELFWGRI